MYILIIMNFIFTCCLGVFFFIKLKDKEDDIEELYNVFYEELQINSRYFNNEKQNKIKSKSRGRVIEL